MKQALKIFKSLSDPTRLRILLLLLRNELCVCELTYILEMEQSRISHQLRVLRSADLVEDIRQGKWIVYRVSADMKKDLNRILERLAGEQTPEMEKDRERLEAALNNDIRTCSARTEEKPHHER